MIKYLDERYFEPRIRMELNLKDHRLVGDAFWFGYDLTFTYSSRQVTMQGMAVCRKDGETWRLLNMHNSHESVQ